MNNLCQYIENLDKNKWPTKNNQEEIESLNILRIIIFTN